MRALWMALACAAMLWSGSAGAAVHAVDGTATIQQVCGGLPCNYVAIGTIIIPDTAIRTGDTLLIDVTIPAPITIQRLGIIFPVLNGSDWSLPVNGGLTHILMFNVEPSGLIYGPGLPWLATGFSFSATMFGLPFDYTLSEFTYRIGSVPEPSTWLLLLLGFVGLAASSHSRRLVHRYPSS